MLYRELLLRCEWPEWWLAPTTIVGFRRLLEGFSPAFARAGVPVAGMARLEALLTWPLTPQPQSTPLETPLNYEGGMRPPEPHSHGEC